MVQKISVVGAGNMGQGFGIHFAMYDRDVTMIDHRDSNLQQAADRMAHVASELSAVGITDRSPDQIRDRLSFTTDQPDGVADAELVLETVPEELQIKRDVFTEVCEHAPSDAILASNTSGIPITEIQAAVPDCADRVVGCHWWFPPYLLEPVEIVRGEHTSDRTMDRIRAFVEGVDRRPIT
ncbi:MAG: 3-hydroxyacyl-CoA dehydrogenase family protein, partial [Halobacteriota archaeon]